MRHRVFFTRPEIEEDTMFPFPTIIRLKTEILYASFIKNRTKNMRPGSKPAEDQRNGSRNLPAVNFSSSLVPLRDAYNATPSVHTRQCENLMQLTRLYNSDSTSRLLYQFFAEYTSSQMSQNGYSSMYHSDICAQLMQQTNQLEQNSFYCQFSITSVSKKIFILTSPKILSSIQAKCFQLNVNDIGNFFPTKYSKDCIFWFQGIYFYFASLLLVDILFKS